MNQSTSPTVIVIVDADHTIIALPVVIQLHL
jgi:hypothetical protein